MSVAEGVDELEVVGEELDRSAGGGLEDIKDFAISVADHLGEEASLGFGPILKTLADDVLE